MNRLIFCILLLFIGQFVLAEELYRWVEPDGSITFSPSPPPPGIEYKAVNAAHNNAATADLPMPEADLTTPSADPTTIHQKRSILATSEHSLETPQQTNYTTDVIAQPAPVPERQKLTYAPDIGTINKTPINVSDAKPESRQSVVSPADSVTNSKKRRQCEDLSKRVLSLERRLRSPLTPVDMDNTVVAMARYQRSYEQHCVE